MDVDTQLPEKQALPNMTKMDPVISWFIGYSNVDKPDLVVAIIVEGGGTGSEAAVPIAADLFDAYYFD